MRNLLPTKAVIIGLSLIAWTSTNLTAPVRAHAAIGVFINPAVSLAGFYIMWTSVASTITAEGAAYATKASTATKAGIALAGIGGFFLGLLILDDKQGTLEYKPLTQKSAEKLKLTPDQFEAYNSELPKINKLNQTILQKLNQEALLKTPQPTAKESTERSAELWAEYKDNISTEALEALFRVVSPTPAQ